VTNSERSSWHRRLHFAGVPRLTGSLDSLQLETPLPVSREWAESPAGGGPGHVQWISPGDPAWRAVTRGGIALCSSWSVWVWRPTRRTWPSSTEQETLCYYLRDRVPTTDGLRLGESTLDELYVGWRPTPEIRVRVGRMQTGFELAGVPRKSLDRNDSPNTDVSWTDGVHVTVPVGEGWRHHLIIQRNGGRGATNAVRSPLDVTGSGSRATLFGSIEAEGRLGPIIQREFDVTFIPRAVPPSAEDAGRGHYTAVVIRAAVESEPVLLGGRPVVGIEGGLASGAPSRAVLGTGGPEDGRGDGWAFQISANLMGMRGGHSLGIVHSQAGDAWLISPDIRENNREVEGRYYWQYATWGRLDIRYRHRQDMRLRPGALERRTDRDVYVRTTIRF
jgi:hypothetical protein